MTAGFEFEFSSPTLSGPCECCGGSTVRLTRFVYRDGDAFGIYYATYSNNHPRHEIHALFSLGEWGEDSSPIDRCAFFCTIRAVSDSYEVMLGDAADSDWADVELVGSKLSRAQGLAHPWKAQVFELLDQALAQDPSLRGYFRRVECGDPSVPLEHSFAMPDEIFSLDESERHTRAELGRAFCVLDAEQYFVRCLVPLPVEGRGAWHAGVWVAVSAEDYQHIREVWDVSDRYLRLRFEGKIANGLEGLGLPFTNGMAIRAGAIHADRPPQVLAAATAEAESLLHKVWGREEFEAWAIARGLL